MKKQKITILIMAILMAVPAIAKKIDDEYRYEINLPEDSKISIKTIKYKSLEEYLSSKDTKSKKDIEYEEHIFSILGQLDGLSLGEKIFQKNVNVLDSKTLALLSSLYDKNRLDILMPIYNEGLVRGLKDKNCTTFAGSKMAINGYDDTDPNKQFPIIAIPNYINLKDKLQANRFLVKFNDFCMDRPSFQITYATTLYQEKIKAANIMAHKDIEAISKKFDQEKNIFGKLGYYEGLNVEFEDYDYHKYGETLSEKFYDNSEYGPLHRLQALSSMSSEKDNFSKMLADYNESKLKGIKDKYCTAEMGEKVAAKKLDVDNAISKYKKGYDKYSYTIYIREYTYNHRDKSNYLKGFEFQGSDRDINVLCADVPAFQDSFNRTFASLSEDFFSKIGYRDGLLTRFHKFNDNLTDLSSISSRRRDQFNLYASFYKNDHFSKLLKLYYKNYVASIKDQYCTANKIEDLLNTKLLATPFSEHYYIRYNYLCYKDDCSIHKSCKTKKCDNKSWIDIEQKKVLISDLCEGRDYKNIYNKIVDSHIFNISDRKISSTSKFVKIFTGGGSSYTASTGSFNSFKNMQPENGQGHSFTALREDGSIHSWGRSDVVKNDPNETDFVKIAITGNLNHAGLRKDGSIKIWGSDENKILNAPSGKFVDVAANNAAFAAIRKDGSIEAWGSRLHGGTGAPTGKGFKAIIGSTFAFSALKDDGHIVAWGLTSDDESGVPKDGEFIAITSNYNAFAALKKDGFIKVWGGWSNFGIIDDTPTNTGFTAIAGSANSFAALTSNGSIKSWGAIKNIEVPKGSGFTFIIGNGSNAFATLKKDGSIKSWGIDPIYKAAPSGNGFVKIAAIKDSFAALHKDGSIATWGMPVKGTPTGNDFTSIIGNTLNFAALKKDGTIYTWNYSYIDSGGRLID